VSLQLCFLRSSLPRNSGRLGVSFASTQAAAFARGLAFVVSVFSLGILRWRAVFCIVIILWQLRSEL
jgi:hypothetical protein